MRKWSLTVENEDSSLREPTDEEMKYLKEAIADGDTSGDLDEFNENLIS